MEHKKYASAEQKLRLVQLVEADPLLRSGKFSSTFSKADSKKKWESISLELNSLTGARKTYEEWRKTWQDRKANAKKRFALMRRKANLTGGGPAVTPPTLEESIVLATIDEQSLVGHSDSQESKATFIDLSQPEEMVLIIPSADEVEKTETKHELIKGTSSPANQSEVMENRNMREEHDLNKEINAPKKAVPRRRLVAQRRLQEGINTTQELTKELKEKNEIKKQFYNEFISLMARQTKALENIAAAIKKD